MSYYLDGQEYKAINRTVLAIVKKYIKENPSVSYSKLKEVFPDSLQGSIGVLKNKADYDEYKKRTSTGNRRFFIDDVLKIDDDEIYICSQWSGDLANGTEGNKDNIFNHAKNILKYDLIDNSNIQTNNNQKVRDRKVQTSEQPQPLNQILYGPPGTGKTYHTIDKALDIINGEVPENRDEAKVKFEEYRQSGQIEFVTFHQSYWYEEFVEGIKAKTTDTGIEYKIESGIFKKLSKKATMNFEQTQKNIVAKKDFDVIFKERVLDKLSENERLEIKMKKSSFFIKEIDESHIYFDKSGGDSQHVLLLKNLRAMYETGENRIIMGGLSQYYNPLLEYLLKDSEIKEEEKEPLKNYILIIDEINRGNISKIFGELITLIEPSKRIGDEESLHVRLPYSNELFGVPSNLYIIGTMNTADRSIALMDTALRRRFDFEEMMPRPELLDFEVEGLHVKRMLETINQRIEYLYDRDHAIGHAYFMSLENNPSLNELENIFKNKIIPLLQEYFYDDWEKILMVLGQNGFIEKKDVKADIFTYKNEEYVEEKQSTYTIKERFDFSEFKK